MFDDFLKWLNGSTSKKTDKAADGQTKKMPNGNIDGKSNASFVVTLNSKQQADLKSNYTPKSSPAGSPTSANDIQSGSLKTSTTDKIPVRINVYSLERVNSKLHYTGFGIYHSGVEVHGNEWAYGGHAYALSGIFKMVQPRDLKSLSDIEGNFKFMQTLRIGYTELSLEQVEALLEQMATRWKGNEYHLLYKNCNNFADELCKILCGKGIPEWINRGATVMRLFPFIVSLIPQEYLSPRQLENDLKKNFHEKKTKAKAELKSSSVASTNVAKQTVSGSRPVEKVEKSIKNSPAANGSPKQDQKNLKFSTSTPAKSVNSCSPGRSNNASPRPKFTATQPTGKEATVKGHKQNNRKTPRNLRDNSKKNPNKEEKGKDEH